MQPYKRKEVIGNATLYLGDCLDLLPTAAQVTTVRTIPFADAIITDPPFGIGNFVQDTGNIRGDKVTWNERPPKPETFVRMRWASEHRIIWGAEHFNCFEGHGALIWDKDQPMEDFSKAEIASKSWGKKTDIFRLRWTNFVNTKCSDHPCERPVDLYKWCWHQIPNLPRLVLDPFMGSGSVGVACMTLSGVQFMGIEIHEPYFDIACERIENEQRQQRLFA